MADSDEAPATPVPVYVTAGAPGQAAVGGKDATLPPATDSRNTVTFPPTPPPVSPPNTPSFSSLVGMPGSDPGARKLEVRGLEHGSVVPFGEVPVSETIEFAPLPAVPGYEIAHEVGRGGMGVVYKARQVSLNRPVALKMILAGAHAGPTERDRFRREASAVAALQNPHIVQIFEIGEANGHLYLALEFVEGGTLAQHLKGAPWPVRDAAELVELLAHAVHYAHSQGVVHRDLKPGNVLLTGGRKSDPAPAGDTRTRLQNSDSQLLVPKITDFGLAKRLGDAANADGTKTGAVMGTPSYIAPEQASGKTREVGPAVDVYALGAILYELLTARPPFLGETPLDTVLQVLHDDPVPPKRLQPAIPRDLETICTKCLNKSPAKRYADAAELAEDIRRFLTGEPIQARPLSAWGRGAKWAKRHPSLAILGIVTVAVTLGLVGVLSVAYAQVKEAVLQKDAEATAAREATARAKLLADENEIARKNAERLANEREKARKEASDRNEDLKREAERTRRAAFALQLTQIAALCERDPKRARDLLNDEVRCPKDLRGFTWAYLQRLCQREERTYSEHTANDPLHEVAYSPTGAFVATAGDAGEVRVWDPRTGRTWAVLVGNTKAVLSVAFSPDGGAIATAGADHAVRLWELPVSMLNDARRTVNLLPFLQPVVKPIHLGPAVTLADAHLSEVNCVAFSPDGRFLVSGGEDGYLQWWHLGGWRAPNPPISVAGGAAAVAAAINHSRLSPKPVWEQYAEPIRAHAGGVKSVAFSTHGNVLVSGGAPAEAKVWPAEGGNVYRTFGNHADAVLAVAVTPDGKTLATVNNAFKGSDGAATIRLFNIESQREIRKLIGHTGAIYSLAMGGEGELLVSAGFDKSVRLWDVDDGKERGVLLGHTLGVSGVAFAPDRKTVVSVGFDGIARVWHTTARPHETAEVFRDMSVTVAGTSGNGATFVAGDERGHVRAYRSDLLPVKPGSSPSDNPFVLIPTLNATVAGGTVRATAASSDGRVLLASTESAIFVWHDLRLPGGRPSGPPFASPRPVALAVPYAVYAMAVDPSGRWLATLDKEGVRLWDLTNALTPHAGTQPVKPDGPGLIHAVPFPDAVAFHPNGQSLAVAGGKSVRVLDRTGKVLAAQPTAHKAQIKAIAFGAKDGHLLATGDTEGSVKVWRVASSGELTPQTELGGHTGAVFSVAFSPDGDTLASGGSDRTVLLSDPLTGQERAALTGHADRVLRVHFLPDASALITFGRDGSVKRWRATGGAQPTTNSPAPPRFFGKQPL